MRIKIKFRYLNQSALRAVGCVLAMLAGIVSFTIGARAQPNRIPGPYVISAPLALEINGLGSVSPNCNGELFQIGQLYTLNAVGVMGFAFTNWVISTNWIGGLVVTQTNLQFTMTSNLTVQANFINIFDLTNTITAPTNGQIMPNALATVLGNAVDKVQIAGVWYQLNNGAWNATSTTNGWTNWAATATLIAGTNTINAYAMDLAGNLSPTSSVSVVSSSTFMLQLAFTNSMPLSTNDLVFSLQSSPGLNGHIQVSSSLTSWATLTNFVGNSTNLSFLDPAATNYSQRYYRAIIP
jgi:hypothetical protein